MMSELPCACLCEHVKKKTGRRGGSTSASHRPDRRHTCTRSRTDVTPTQANLWYERGGILCLAGWRGEGGEEAAEVPYVRKSCSLHHKDHMLASESQRGGRARRWRTERKDYRRAEGGRVCMWISVSFMCQHENAGINGLLCTLLRNTLLLRTWEHVRVHVVTHCCLRVLLGRLPLWAFAYQICMAEYESASL